MKPFNLQEALAGKAVKLRDGRKAFVRHHETELDAEDDYRLVGYTTDGSFLSWCADGSYDNSESQLTQDIIGMYPETRIINGFEVPVHETNELEPGTEIYLASPITGQFYMTDVWGWHRDDKIRLERGLVFLNKEDAIATAKAILGIDPNLGETKDEN